MHCKSCGNSIPEQRLKALPNTRTCIQCSGIERVAGFPIITTKTTYSEIQIVSQETAQELYSKQDRTGGIATGVQFKQQSPPKLSNFE